MTAKKKPVYQHRKKPWSVPRHTHQWAKQPFGRKKCSICGKVQRRRNPKRVTVKKPNRGRAVRA